MAMKQYQETAERVRQKIDKKTKFAISGKNDIVKKIFTVLIEREKIASDILILCAGNGMILYFAAGNVEEGLSGYLLPEDFFENLDRGLLHYDEIGGGYRILSDNDPKTAKKIIAMQKDLKEIIKIFEASELHNRELLNFLDFADNAIAIYDRNGCLMFANKTWYQDFNVPNPEDAIGVHVGDIMKQFHVELTYMEKGTKKYKILDVLESGKEITDCEMRVKKLTSKKPAQLILNDIYPVKDDEGNIYGVFEITRSRQQDIARARKMIGLSAEYTFEDIKGKSRIMQEKIQLAKEYARSSFSVLLSGESGVGKELFAQSIHNYSQRRNGPFVAINCANFPENLIESELFGYVDGAFTGASRKGQIGKFELADKGTLFLDEIGELPYLFQSKLLRVLETWRITRIGSTHEIPVDVRIVAATNRDLEKMVADGFFREDLYYRLQVLNVEIPPLRERKEDLNSLVDALIAQTTDLASNTSKKKLSKEAHKLLIAYDWPGNVRELRNVVNRACILSKEDEISAEIFQNCISPKKHILTGDDGSEIGGLEKKQAEFEKAHSRLMQEIFESTNGDRRQAIRFMDESRKKFERIQIQQMLELANGNKKQAAEYMGVSRKTFYRMLEKYEIN